MPFRKGDKVTVVDASLITDTNVTHPSMIGLANIVTRFAGQTGEITNDSGAGTGQYEVLISSLHNWFDVKWLKPAAMATTTLPPPTPQTKPKFKVGDKVLVLDQSILNKPSANYAYWRMYALGFCGQVGEIKAEDLANGSDPGFKVEFKNGVYNWFDPNWITLALTSNAGNANSVPIANTTFKVGDRIVFVDENTFRNTGDLNNPTIKARRDTILKGWIKPYGQLGKIINFDPILMWRVDLDNGLGLWVDPAWIKPESNSTLARMSFSSVSTGESKPTQLVSKVGASCIACGGYGSHRLGCPPTSSVRNKSF